MAGTKVVRLAQVALTVTDMERAKAFYGGTLGLPTCSTRRLASPSSSAARRG